MPVLLQINVVGNTTSTGKIAEMIGKQTISAGWDSYIAFGRRKRESMSQRIAFGNN
jgi:hypothetical protein